jgi:AraC-like DNA-binding protein
MTIPGWLRKARSLVDRECMKPWTIDTLADEVGIDPTHLARQFTVVFGKTPQECLLENRAMGSPGHGDA